MNERLFEQLLRYYCLSKEDYARISGEPSFLDIPSLKEDAATLALVKRLEEARDKKEKIIIYGDYDTDGIMATSIMTRALREFGIQPSFFIPSRYKDAYGLNMNNAMAIAKKGYDLVLCVDNGVTCNEPIAYLKEQGIETLIIDHHEFGELPEAKAIVHPALCGLKDVETSAGFMCFLVSRVLLGKDDHYLATLGATSVISDCMPMKGYNQKLVALALRFLAKEKYLPFTLLTEKSRIDEKVLGMDIIPQINAVGRMEKEHEGLKLIHYFADVEGDKEKCATYMAEINMRRKEATKAAEERLLVDPSSSGILVLGKLPEGLNGLLANRLLYQYKKPVGVFSVSESDPSLYVGSLRSMEGCNIMEAEEYCKDYLVRGGGHAFAGGVSVRIEDFEAFSKAFDSFCASHPIKEEKPHFIDINLEDISLDTFRLVRSFGPFGQDYKEPYFRIKSFPASKCFFTRDGRFLSVKVGEGSKIFSFAFSRNDLKEERLSYDLYGSLGLDVYRGVIGITLYCDSVE